MTTTRRILVLAAVALAGLGASTPAHADPAPATGAAGDLSVHQDQDLAAGRCRWVKRIGIVCETENGTITL